MKKSNRLLPFCLILCFCCGQANKIELKYNISSVSIPINAKYSGSIYKPFFKKANGKSLLYSLDRVSNAIEIFDLDALVPIEKIYFDLNGPNGVGSIYEFYPHNSDSIFLLSDYDLFITNQSSKVLYNLDIFDQKKFQGYFLHPKGTLGSYGLYFDSKESRVYGRFIKRDISRESVDYYKNPIEGSINLKDTSLTMFDFAYPEVYQGEYQFGVLSYGSRTIYDNKFIYSFHVDPNIYILSKDGTVITKKNPRENSLSTLARSEVDQQSLYENLLANDVYLEVIPDRFNKVYYQFVLGSVDIKQANGNMSDPGTKPISLKIFNSEFEKLGQINLDYNTYLPVHCFVTEDGLWLNKETPYRESNLEDVIEYDIISFEIQ